MYINILFYEPLQFLTELGVRSQKVDWCEVLVPFKQTHRKLQNTAAADVNPIISGFLKMTHKNQWKYPSCYCYLLN